MTPRLPVDCTRVEQDGIIERYVAAESCRSPLSESVVTEFEEHYFACAGCFERLQAARAARAALGRNATRKPLLFWAIAAAAAIAVTLVSYGYLRRAQPVPPSVATSTPPGEPGSIPKAALRSTPLAELARLDPPKYESAVLRGNDSEPERQFQTAMKIYLNGDFVSAAGTLTAVVQRYPDFVPARFFLGACQLLAGKPDVAIEEMTRVLARESPFKEEANWILAKAWLTKGDVARARGLLDQLVAGEGDFADAARQLRSRLDNLR